MIPTRSRALPSKTLVRRCPPARAAGTRESAVDGSFLDAYVREVCPLIAHDRDPLACLHEMRVPDIDDQQSIARLAEGLDGTSLGSLKGVVIWLLTRGETERAVTALQQYDRFTENLEGLRALVQTALVEMNAL